MSIQERTLRIVFEWFFHLCTLLQYPHLDWLRYLWFFEDDCGRDRAWWLRLLVKVPSTLSEQPSITPSNVTLSSCFGAATKKDHQLLSAIHTSPPHYLHIHYWLEFEWATWPCLSFFYAPLLMTPPWLVTTHNVLFTSIGYHKVLYSLLPYKTPPEHT